jgi:hypothetical protein
MKQRTDVSPGLDPVLFMDIDDVLILDRGVSFDKNRVGELTAEVCMQLIHPPAGQALSALVEELHPRLVVTSNWTRFTSKRAFERLFRLAGYGLVAKSLHDEWSTIRRPGATRLQAVDEWLAANHSGEPFFIIDDQASGAALRGSRHDQAGRVLLCDVGKGLHRGHVPQIRTALKAK